MSKMQKLALGSVAASLGTVALVWAVILLGHPLMAFVLGPVGMYVAGYLSGRQAELVKSGGGNVK